MNVERKTMTSLLGRERQETVEFKVILDCLVSPSLQESDVGSDGWRKRETGENF